MICTCYMSQRCLNNRPCEFLRTCSYQSLSYTFCPWGHCNCGPIFSILILSSLLSFTVHDIKWIWKLRKLFWTHFCNFCSLDIYTFSLISIRTIYDHEHMLYLAKGVINLHFWQTHIGQQQNKLFCLIFTSENRGFLEIIHFTPCILLKWSRSSTRTPDPRVRKFKFWLTVPHLLLL